MFQNAIKDTAHHSKLVGNLMRLGALCSFSLLLGLMTSAQVGRYHTRLSEPESINRPNAAARRAGYSDGQLVLAKQPKDRSEAIYWLHWFTSHSYTVSIGLMQVNSEMAPQFHLKPEQLFEPCTNLRVGAAILISVYTDLARKMGEGLSALDAALSFYNSGNSVAGFRNGYVANVYAHAPRRSALFSP